MRVGVVDSHAGGEPFRVVIAGLPDLEGETVLDRRRHARRDFDHLRRALMWEPRGHHDMYGGWLGPAVEPGSDMSVLFMHNEGFSTMCGHGIIALAKVVLDTGIVAAASDEQVLLIDTPAGTITSTSTIVDGSVTKTRFRNVASFVVDLDQTIEVQGHGLVPYDLAFGGAFYAIVDADALGLSLDDVASLVESGRAIKTAISRSVQIMHPAHPDLGFLYGVIFTGAPAARTSHSRNVCVFADGEVDRSPTGTGVSARLAILSARGLIEETEEIIIESLVGSTFGGRVVGSAQVGDVDAVLPEITGSAHIVGRSELWIDPRDVLGRGFSIG